jgi:hypothetical protein
VPRERFDSVARALAPVILLLGYNSDPRRAPHNAAILARHRAA